jgi:hypothetical protein
VGFTESDSYGQLEGTSNRKCVRQVQSEACTPSPIGSVHAKSNRKCVRQVQSEACTPSPIGSVFAKSNRKRARQVQSEVCYAKPSRKRARKSCRIRMMIRGLPKADLKVRLRHRLTALTDQFPTNVRLTEAVKRHSNFAQRGHKDLYHLLK